MNPALARWVPALVTAAVLAAMLGFAWTKTSFAPPEIAGPARALKCPSQSLLGIRCAGCGTTRAVAAAIEGRWRDAFAFNPILPFALAFALYVLVRGTSALRGRHWPWTLLAIVAAYMIAINLVAPEPGAPTTAAPARGAGG